MAFKPKLGSNLGSLLEQEKQKQEIEKQNALMKTSKEGQTKLEVKFKSPEEAKERIRIIFDDSGSMSGQKIKDARDGCIEFMRNCVVNETACAIHLMNPQYQSGLVDISNLTTNLPALSILIQKIEAPGGTPLFETTRKAQASKPSATRYVVFSDGCPDNEDDKEQVISKAIEEKTPIDTVLISSYEVTEIDRAYQILKELADRTGGYFLVFDRNKVDFKSAFKYLAPTLRGRLSDGKVRLALIAGELK